MKYLLYLVFSIPLGNASETSIKNDTMNGYKLSTYAGFEKDWKLVTVRYRKDNGEIRFTYANELAFQTLKNGSVDYPDGSVFAKIAQKSQEDPAFTSSAVPSGTRRYQFMVRDKKKHSTTEGWGYALFDKEGVVFPEKLETQTNACAACHRIVPERGYVFSELMSLSPGHDELTGSNTKTFFKTKINYVTMDLNDSSIVLSKKIRSLLPKSADKIRKLDHEISQYLFQGTLDEIKPTLTKEAIRSKMPTLIFDESQKTYALVFVENFDINCESEGKKGLFIKAVSSSDAQKGKIYENRYCWVD